MQDKTITISPSLAADYSVISWSQRPLSCMAGEGAFYWRPTMRAKIYTLSEPSGAIRYVGKTIQTLKRRLYFHLCDTRRGIKNHRCNWIRLLLKKGLVPIIREIDEVEGDGCNREIGWISFFRRLGLDLVNGTDGGEGLLGCHPSAETRQRISEGHKGQISWSKGKTGVYSKETLIKMSEAHKNMSFETRRKMSESRMDTHPSLKSRKKMREAKKGYIPWNKDKTGIFSKETLKKMSKSQKRRWNERKIANSCNLSQNKL